MTEGKLSADLRISKRFKYTPIFKTSFIKAKEKPPRRWCACCDGTVARITGYVFLVLLFIFSSTGSIVLWATNTYHQVVIENLALKNYSQAFEWWQKPPVQPKVQIYIFNYTNVPDFLNNGTKLKVEELGPYTYLETLEKVNLIWNNNGTITFQERRNYKFVPELSSGWETDRLVVPNIPLLSAVAVVRNEFYFVRLSLATLLRSINARPFVRVSVNELLWGYDDPLFSMARTVLALKQQPPTRKFGLLLPKLGVSPWRITVNTGELEMAKLGVVSHYNGEDSLDYWRSEECNRIDGAEGANFPPAAIKKFSRVHVYNRDFCRRLPLDFKEHSQVWDGIPTLRFQPPRDVFAHPDENPDNACFCDPARAVCPPSGVFNVSPCVFDAPIFVSFPHFYLGDPVLLETVEGLKPDPKRHEMYIDLHSELGVPLSGKSAFQLNVMVMKANGVDHLDAFNDRDILPISWVNVVLDELPEELRFAMYHVTFSVRALQLVLMYGLPAVAACCALALLREWLRARGRLRAPAPPPVPAATAAVIALSPDDILIAP
ncbi:hypothetical protein R5R35_014360 [Gryllus longicercus]|uniref:Scavenger receptor class B member 1 n=1 Tax=Gryllus longicercus TaxID=2509291 RepID=A0AAN9VNC8_9ORTH